MMRCTIPINERRRRKSHRCRRAVTRRRSRRPARSWKHVRRPCRPHDSAAGHAEWHCYAAFASGRRRPRGGGDRTKARKAGETIVRKSAMAQANALSHAMGHWHPVCGPSLRRKEPHKARHREDWRTSSDGKLISRDTRLRRHEACRNAVNIVNIYEKKDSRFRVI